MNLLFWRRKPTPDPCPASPEVQAAQAKADELRVRADRVAESLGGRLRRNHWGETVASIARRD